MKKTSIIIIVTFSLCFLMLFTGCEKYINVSNDVEGFVFSHVFLNGESVSLDIGKIFENSGIDITRYKIKAADESLLSIKGNKISVKKSGMSDVSVTLFESSTKTQYSVKFARVYAVLESDMTPVYTIEDLNYMRVAKSGNFILKSDLDLAGIKWEPIGNYPAGGEFSGMFVNTGGFKIKNLTVSSADDVFHGPYGGCNGGLFGQTKNSFFYGLELINAHLDVSDFVGESQSYTGVIASGSLSDTFMNCKASGYVSAQSSTGGIAGNSSWSRFIDCEFSGNVVSCGEEVSNAAGAGGICGAAGGGEIKGCKVNAQINGAVYGGGIVGCYTTFGGFLSDNVFDGTVDSPRTYDSMFGGYIVWGGDVRN